MSYYGNGKFEFIHDETERELYKNAHWAITQCELWDWLSSFQVEDARGFIYSSTSELEMINEKMREQHEIADLHSGASYGLTMRTMDFIAKHGYEALRVKKT